MPVTSLWSDFIVEESHHEQCTPMNEAGLVLEGRIQDRPGIAKVHTGRTIQCSVSPGRGLANSRHALPTLGERAFSPSPRRSR